MKCRLILKLTTTFIAQHAGMHERKLTFCNHFGLFHSTRYSRVTIMIMLVTKRNMGIMLICGEWCVCFRTFFLFSFYLFFFLKKIKNVFTLQRGNGNVDKKCIRKFKRQTATSFSGLNNHEGSNNLSWLDEYAGFFPCFSSHYRMDRTMYFFSFFMNPEKPKI